ncbi:hypothetical protein FRX31_008348 [Thalictrum thalictroides]|uniref:Uncharacterized protein n=1 Tax=Thalictrum thalictroides TaxID=46969 RepID=A0A7J6WXA4_THATH|nr:hypothetical protein FRX31_008348 [Thalictrum thalictroides]
MQMCNYVRRNDGLCAPYKHTPQRGQLGLILLTSTGCHVIKVSKLLALSLHCRRNGIHTFESRQQWSSYISVSSLFQLRLHYSKALRCQWNNGILTAWKSTYIRSNCQLNRNKWNLYIIGCKLITVSI